MSKRRPMLGQTFGRLTVVDDSPQHSTTGLRKVTVVCSCGTSAPFSAVAGNLRSGKTSSCGCRRKESTTTHGMHNHRLYQTWYWMLDRCYREEAAAYPNYGGRGITVADEWHGDSGLLAFIAWANASGWEEGLELDRRNNDGEYSSSNCRWVTKSKNARNKRNNRIIEFNGRRVTLAEAAELSGIPYHTIHRRLHKGWSSERATTTPIRRSA